MPGIHALLAPSAAHRWLNCGGSIALTKNFPSVDSDFSREGTCGHRLAQICLEDGNNAQQHIGAAYYVGDNEKGVPINWPVTKELADLVSVYVNYVREEARGKSLLIEQRLPLTAITGEPDAFGTSDAVIIDGLTLTIVDLKLGYVEVEADANEQLMLYAAAARERFKLLGDFKLFTVTIVQPKRDKIESAAFTNVELDFFVDEVKAAAPAALDGTAPRIPGDHCRYCEGNKRNICPELTASIIDVVADQTPVTELKADYLAANMRAVPVIESWCKNVRAELERRMLVEGHKIPGWKIVEGRRGAREWTDAKQAEAALMKFVPVEKIYELLNKPTLRTPTQVEKLAKALPEAWAVAQQFITQSEGKPSVAPSTDPRSEAGAVIDSFEVVQ